MRYRLSSDSPKFPISHVVKRHTDDAAAWNKATAGKMKKARKQFAPGQIACGTNQNQYLGLLWAHTLRNFPQRLSRLMSYSRIPIIAASPKTAIQLNFLRGDLIDVVHHGPPNPSAAGKVLGTVRSRLDRRRRGGFPRTSGVMAATRARPRRGLKFELETPRSPLAAIYPGVGGSGGGPTPVLSPIGVS